MRTTLESLVAAALSTDSETLGNNSGAKYTNRFVFADGKYSFEAHCLDDENIWVELCEVDEEESSKVLIGHCLHVMHNPDLAPIFAHFLWADFESLLHSSPSLSSRINREEFANALLNFREDDLTDRANSTIEQVFRTATEYEKRADETGTVHFFLSREYGAVYLNPDCLEYYAGAGALKALPEDIQSKFSESDLEFLKKLQDFSMLTGLTTDEIDKSATQLKLKLLDEILEIVDRDCFDWALNAKKRIDEAANKRYANIANIAKQNKNSANAYSECLEYFKDKHWEDLVEAAKEIFNWQAQRGISFDLQTLALLFNELGLYEHFEFADDLLRDASICYVLIQAFVSPYSYIQ